MNGSKTYLISVNVSPNIQHNSLYTFFLQSLTQIMLKNYHQPTNVNYSIHLWLKDMNWIRGFVEYPKISMKKWFTQSFTRRILGEENPSLR